MLTAQAVSLNAFLPNFLLAYLQAYLRADQQNLLSPRDAEDYFSTA
jgi:hypothetical protein